MKNWFAIGTYNCKFPQNTGTIWRTADSFGANYIFTIGERYQHQRSDTRKAWQSIPMHQYTDFFQFFDTLPKGCQLIGVEITPKSKPLNTFKHPPRAVYLLGAEDTGLLFEVIKRCHQVIQVPFAEYCLNVSMAAGIIMYDRRLKEL